VKTEITCVFAAVNCKVWKSAVALQLIVVLSGVYKVSTNPIIQSETRLIVTHS
jgi:hypothetical protein